MTDSTSLGLRIVLVADDADTPLTRQLAPYLDDRAAELVVVDGNGAGAPLDHDPDILLLDLDSRNALSALDEVRSSLRHWEDPPTVLLGHLRERNEVLGELLSCATKKLRPDSADGQPSLDDITPRQREILRMVARSHTSREIGEKLGISPRTVETHRANMMQRLGIHDVAGLVRFAVSEGLVSPEP